MTDGQTDRQNYDCHIIRPSMVALYGKIRSNTQTIVSAASSLISRNSVRVYIYVCPQNLLANLVGNGWVHCDEICIARFYKTILTVYLRTLVPRPLATLDKT